MTKEEKKKIYMKAYRLANKEKIASQVRAYNEANKVSISEYNKQYRFDNKELISKKLKDRYTKNKASVKSKVLSYKQTLKDDFYTVYYLKEEHYIGVTNQPKIRMQNQKRNGKHVLDYEVVTTVKTKREALDIESLLHKLNYNGKHPQIK